MAAPVHGPVVVGHAGVQGRMVNYHTEVTCQQHQAPYLGPSAASIVVNTYPSCGEQPVTCQGAPQFIRQGQWENIYSTFAQSLNVNGGCIQCGGPMCSHPPGEHTCVQLLQRWLQEHPNLSFRIVAHWCDMCVVVKHWEYVLHISPNPQYGGMGQPGMGGHVQMQPAPVMGSFQCPRCKHSVSNQFKQQHDAHCTVR